MTARKGRREGGRRHTHTGREKRNEREKQSGKQPLPEARQAESQDEREDVGKGRPRLWAGGRALLNRRSVLRAALRGFLQGRGKLVGERAPRRPCGR